MLDFADLSPAPQPPLLLSHSYQFMLKSITDIQIVIFGLALLSVNFFFNVITVMPFINHCYFNRMEKGKNHLKWIAHR